MKRLHLTDPMVNLAYKFAKTKHAGQLDDEGKDYFKAHIRKVAKVVEVLTGDRTLTAAAYLHDVLEDTKTDYNELMWTFPKEICDIVYAVTHEGKKDNYGYFFPRLKPTIENKGAILIKLVDRASNISRMNNWDIERQLQYLKKSQFWKTDYPSYIDFSESLDPQLVAATRGELWTAEPVGWFSKLVWRFIHIRFKSEKVGLPYELIPKIKNQ